MSPRTVSDVDAVCASCHREIYERYRETPMARATGPALDGIIPADFQHKSSGVHYRITSRDGHPPGAVEGRS